MPATDAGLPPPSRTSPAWSQAGCQKRRGRGRRAKSMRARGCGTALQHARGLCAARRELLSRPQAFTEHRPVEVLEEQRHRGVQRCMNLARWAHTQ